MRANLAIHFLFLAVQMCARRWLVVFGGQCMFLTEQTFTLSSSEDMMRRFWTCFDLICYYYFTTPLMRLHAYRWGTAGYVVNELVQYMLHSAWNEDDG
jgi:hypothetical protein